MLSLWAWHAAVAGFGGLRDHGDTLTFAPTLPPRLKRLCFRVLYRARRLQVEIVPGEARYELLAGEPLDVIHHGNPVTLNDASPVTLAWQAQQSQHDAVAPPRGRHP